MKIITEIWPPQANILRNFTTIVKQFWHLEQYLRWIPVGCRRRKKLTLSELISWKLLPKSANRRRIFCDFEVFYHFSKFKKNRRNLKKVGKRPKVGESRRNCQKVGEVGCLDSLVILDALLKFWCTFVIFCQLCTPVGVRGAPR